MYAENLLFKSQNLNKEIELKVYGHYGIAILLFPALSDSASEYEDNGLVGSLEHLMKKGKCRVYCTPSVNSDTWFNDTKTSEEKSKYHYLFNNFIIEELVPQIYSQSSGPIPIITAGADIGAYHAANSYFRRPDVFTGCVAMSGFYNLENLTKGFFDSNCYFNSPLHYLPNLNDNYWMSFLKSKKHVYILSGSGEGEKPEDSRYLADVLSSKGIPHQLDIWNEDWKHEWKTWNAMLPRILETKL